VREIAIPLLEQLKDRTGLGLSACLGTLHARDYSALQAAGRILRHRRVETGNAEHYRFVQAPGVLQERFGSHQNA